MQGLFYTIWPPVAFHRRLSFEVTYHTPRGAIGKAFWVLPSDCLKKKKEYDILSLDLFADEKNYFEEIECICC